MADNSPPSTVEIKSKDTIKPSSPTPPHLKIHKLSLLDQLAVANHIPVIFFYHCSGDDISQKSQTLKSSLSHVLTHFYPLAGRIEENDFVVNCNDQGVDYIEAQVSCNIHDFLKHPDLEVLHKLVSTEKMDSVLIVQVNFFKCGGVAIGVSFSHRVMDLSAFALFVKSWAAINGDGKVILSPEFDVASALPPVKPSLEVPRVELVMSECVTRRCVFSGEKLKELKAKFASGGNKQPSRVEAVTALLWKCAIVASHTSRGFLRPSTLTQLVNLRKKLDPPLSENHMGNALSIFMAKIEDGVIELQALATHLRRKLEEFTVICAGKDGREKAASILHEFAKDCGKLSKVMNFYICTSWCRFPLYEVDFKWGKPSWVSYVPFKYVANNIVLLDTKECDGIEAWVSLSEEDMIHFEQDQNLLAFASLDPSVIN